VKGAGIGPRRAKKMALWRFCETLKSGGVFALFWQGPSMRQDLVILGEYNPDSETHPATNAAIHHSLRALNAGLSVNWISTATINESDILKAHGLWIAPGSPYEDFSRALQAIRLARENSLPCLGTCGGFQHMILEFARNVLGFADAHHAEYNPGPARLFISALSCSVQGRELLIKLQPGTTARNLYGRDEAVERYYCTFGVNPEYADVLAARLDLVISGKDLNGEIRIIEIPHHPFFLGTLFVPQTQSRESRPHPLVNGFLEAVLRHRGGRASDGVSVGGG
jgi:CTP synthase (UTP-ammonia lyase)